MLKRDSPQTVLLALVIIGLISVFAGIAWFVGGIAGMQFAGVVTSGFLTAALVVLYFRQTSLLKDQINLRAQELNRDVRQSHTETLRERVYAWLGTDDVPRTIDSVDEIIDSSKRRLPKVTAVDIEPPEESIYSNHSPEDFGAVPFGLEDDRYFVDLLENHAPGLKEKKDDIEAGQSTFAELRNQFVEEFEGSSLKRESLTIEPDVDLSRWVFESLVKVERGRSDDWNEELKPVRDGFEDRNNPDRANGEIRFSYGGMTHRWMFQITTDEGNIEDVSEDEARSLAIEALRQTVDQVDSEDQPYQKALDAAETLDTLEEEIHELRMELIEYAGRPVFPGDCDYLDEAAIEGAESR
ncbi:hypothetical protein [Halorubellus litoreus]|uniref:Uncharacterized protein n=1 Tax=Halorubellus litoreus TaxID=755308 RepID=A0ABD5VI60_9EURY